MDHLPPIAEEAPWSDQVTAYDHAHLVLYVRLLDAEADGADTDEIARIVLGVDPARDPDRASRMLQSHMRRAHWMCEQGFRHLLNRSGRSAIH